jgi:hypothetical protein
MRFFFFDMERRYYREGGREEQFYYTGLETFAGNFIFRGGMFGTNLGKVEDRHATGGISFKDANGYQLSYAIDVFDENDVSVKRSLLSLSAPFGPGAKP